MGIFTKQLTKHIFSSANEVKTGPTCQEVCVCHIYAFRLFSQGLLFVEILDSGIGSGTLLIQDIVTSNARAWLS